MNEKKTCKKCNKKKELLYFRKRSNRNTFQNICKKCEGKIANEWHRAHKIETNTYLRKWRKKNYCKNGYYAIKYRTTHPIQINSRRIANKIKIKMPCYFCKSTYKIEKHHPDYSKPMEIVFLCKVCHSKIHAEAKKKKQLELSLCA